MLLKTTYKFKKSYGGAPEPQTAQDAPWLRGPSLNIEDLNVKWGYPFYSFLRHYQITFKIKPL